MNTQATKVARDLIVGVAAGYTWNELYPFVISLRHSGYTGRCILITGIGPRDLVARSGELLVPPDDTPLAPKLAAYNIETLDVGAFTSHPILLRHAVIPRLIKQNVFRYVIAIDTKDIIFQSDPTVWLEQRLPTTCDLAIVTEGMRYEGPIVGNKKNILEAFGIAGLARVDGKQILNCGVLAGRAEAMRELCTDIYKLCQTDLRLQKFVPMYQDMIADQSAMNILVRSDAYKSRTVIVQPGEGLAAESAHKGTSFRNGLLYPPGNAVPYAIVHQYFCMGIWREIRARYCE